MEKKQEKPFQTRDSGDGSEAIEEVIDYSKKLEALGSMIGAVAWYERGGLHPEAGVDSGTQVFYDHGETIGEIISDYAQAIGERAEKNYRKWAGWDREGKAPDAVKAAPGA